MTAIIVAIVFIILIVLDFLGHRKYQVRRKVADWVFLCLIIAGAVLCIVFPVMKMMSAGSEKNTGQYLAYRYLMDGDAGSARSVTIQDEKISRTQKQFLEMLACGLEGDYRRVYFAADEFLSDPSELPEQKTVAEKLYTISMNAVADGSKQKQAIEECIQESYEASKIAETVELQEYYELDKQIRANNIEGIQPVKINALVRSFPEETGVKKLAISYYVQSGDFESALSVADQLLSEDRSAASKVLYTDIYAQMAYQMSEEEIRSLEDSEVAALVKKSDAAAQKAAGYEADNENAAKQTELSIQYLESVPDVFYQRIENYLLVKKPFMEDRTGLYNLQLAKMKFLKGERKEAAEAFASVLENASELAESSPVRAELLQMAADLKLFRQTGEDEYKEAVFNDCYDVFRAQSQDVIRTDEADINKDAAAQFAAMMLYDREIFELTSIDTSAYPKVTVSVNTNVQKANIFGGFGEFYKDDFRIKENDTSLSDYSMTAFIGIEDRSVVIAHDIVGTDENSLADLKAVLSLAKEAKTAKRLAVVNGNAEVSSFFDDSDSKYRTAVRETKTGGNASAYRIIEQACAVLTEKKYEDKVIIFISDDPAINEESALEILTLLKENGIRMFILALDGLDPASAELMAKESGAMTLSCSRSEELSSALFTLIDLMNNRYLFTYKAGEDISGRHEVTVELISEDLSASGEYLREGIS